MKISPIQVVSDADVIIGILLKAVKTGVINKSEAIDLLKKMMSQDFRIHPDILQRAIAVVED